MVMVKPIWRTRLNEFFGRRVGGQLVGAVLSGTGMVSIVLLLAGLLGPAAAAAQEVLRLPPPVGHEQGVLRIAAPHMPGHWLVRWVQPLSSGFFTAFHWQEEVARHYPTHQLTPNLWRLDDADSVQPVLLQRLGEAWMLSQWQTEANDPLEWRRLRRVKGRPERGHLISDWLIEAELQSTRQQIWHEPSLGPHQWLGELSRNWRTDGWQTVAGGTAGNRHALALETWQREGMERSAVVVPVGTGSVLFLTHRLRGLR